MAGGVYRLQDHRQGDRLRASDEEQLRGLDLTEHGSEGFPEFMGGMGSVPDGVPLASPAD